MNFTTGFLVFLAIIGATNVNANPIKDSNELNEVLGEFGVLVLDEEIGQLLEDYLLNDTEFNAAIEYLFSDEFKDLVKKFNNIEDVINLCNYLEEAGLNIDDLVNKVHNLIDLSFLKTQRGSTNIRTTGGLAGFITDYKAILPINKIKALQEEKLKSSKVFARFIDYWTSPRFQELGDALRVNKEFQELLNVAEKCGIEIKPIADLYSATLDLEFSSSQLVKRSVELKKDMREFSNLVPRKKLREIWKKYLSSDEEFSAIVEYFFSDAFKDLVQEVENIDDVMNVCNYLEEAGLDVHAIMNELHFLIGLPLLNTKQSERSVRITGGLTGFVADYKAILPIDKIKALHQKKLETSPAFAYYIGQLMSPRFQKFVDALWANEEFQTLHNIAKEGGVDLEAIVDLYTTTLAIEFPN